VSNSVGLVALAIFVVTHLSSVPSPSPTPTPQPTPPPVTTSYVALGKAQASILKSSHADAWDAAAASLKAGQTVVQAQQVYAAKWSSEVKAQYDAQITPTQAAIVANPTAGITDIQRAELVKMMNDMATGLRK